MIKKLFFMMIPLLMVSSSCWAVSADPVGQYSGSGPQEILLKAICNGIDKSKQDCAFCSDANAVVDALLNGTNLDGHEDLAGLTGEGGLWGLAGRLHRRENPEPDLDSEGRGGEGSGGGRTFENAEAAEQWQRRNNIKNVLFDFLRNTYTRDHPPSSPRLAPRRYTTVPQRVVLVADDRDPSIPPAVLAADARSPSDPSNPPPVPEKWHQKLLQHMHRMPDKRGGVAALISLILLLHGGDSWATSSSDITHYETLRDNARLIIESKHGVMTDEQLRKFIRENAAKMSGMDKLRIGRYFRLKDDISEAKRRRKWARWETLAGGLLGAGTAVRHYRQSAAAA